MKKKKPKVLYVLDTGTQTRAECENKKDTITQWLELLRNANDHWYVDIYFIYDGNVQWTVHNREIEFYINGKEIDMVDTKLVKRMGEFYYENKDELKRVLYL